MNPSGQLYRITRIARITAGLFLLSVVGIPQLAAQSTQWLGKSTFWRADSNWNNLAPTATRDAIVSKSNPVVADAFVPVPLALDTASVRNLTVQSEGILRFEPNGVLIVYGTDKVQNDGSVYLGSGTLIFRGNTTFHQGGLFHADSGTIEFSGGTWENKSGSTFDPGSSTVVFNGAGDQFLIDSSGSLSFYNLQILTQGTVSIDGNIVIEGDCYVAAGATVNVPAGSSLDVQGSFTGDGTVTGEGTYDELPVQLIGFNAIASRSGVTLQWSTASELNNYGFEIERREVKGSEFQVAGSASTWNRIGFIQGAGTTTSRQDYSYVDSDVLPGRYAYRIKQIDFDGSSSYYYATEIEIGLAPKALMLSENYPNPFNPSTTTEFTIPEDGRVVLKVYNLAGQEVATLFDGDAEAGRLYRVTFDARNLASGLYISHFQFGQTRLTKRMILVK